VKPVLKPAPAAPKKIEQPAWAKSPKKEDDIKKPDWLGAKPNPRDHIKGY